MESTNGNVIAVLRKVQSFTLSEGIGNCGWILRGQISALMVIDWSICLPAQTPTCNSASYHIVYATIGVQYSQV